MVSVTGDLIISVSKPKCKINNVKVLVKTAAFELLLIQMFCFCLGVWYDLDCQELQLW